MKYKKTFWCLVLTLFYFFFRFVIEGKTEAKSYYTITSYTSNGHGYLYLVSIATFNCFVFLLFINSFVERFSTQLLVRMTRRALFLKNEIITAICTLLYSVCFLLPHLIFYFIYYGLEMMNEIQFFYVLICQFVTLFLYYFMIANFYLLFYYKSFKLFISIIISFALSSIFVFANMILNIYTPIAAVAAFSDYYDGNASLISIYGKSFSVLIPVIILFSLLNFFEIKNKDIISYER